MRPPTSLRRFHRLLALTLMIAILAPGPARADEMPPPLAALQIVDGRIVDADGAPVLLRGCNTGNWLVLEMWMLAAFQGQVRDQFGMEAALDRRFGAAERERLMESYREHWMTPRDFAAVRSFGMNVVRLPFSADLLLESVEPPRLRPDAWKWLDRAVELAEAEGLYTILDLHGAPGGQSGMDHTGRIGYNRLWSEKRYQDATTWLWRRIAERYARRPSVAAYDLLNEPWGGSHDDLRAMVERLYAEIRDVDPAKIIILPGFTDGIDFYGDPRDRGWTNYLFTMHFYPGFFGWGRPDWTTHARFLGENIPEWTARMERLGVPLLIGEFNVVLDRAGGAAMMRRYYDACAERGWPATMWSYKVLSREGGDERGHWGLATNRGPLPALDLETSSAEEIGEFFASLATMPLAEHEELRGWLTRAEAPPALPEPPPPPARLTEPPAADDLPSGWQATDIGGALPGGQLVEHARKMEIFGGGDDIWDTRDSFRFVWHKVRGDFALTARVDALADVHVYAKAGLMVRASLAPGAPQTTINVFPTGTLESSRRAKVGGTTDATGGPTLDLGEARLRLSRTGAVLLAEYARGEGDFVTLREAEAPELGAEVFVGFAVLSHDNSQLAGARFADIDFTGETIAATPDDLAARDAEVDAATLDQTSTGVGTAAERNTYARSFEFAGRTWSAKRFDVPGGPGDNYFADGPEHLWVDERGLHLTIKRRDGKWWCTEAILQESLGYGTYVFHTEGRVDRLSPDVVFGCFTWDNFGDGPGRWPFREIDFEFARWGSRDDPRNLQFTIQPWDAPGTSHRFQVEFPDPSDTRLTVMWEWTPDAANFRAARGHVLPGEVTAANELTRWSYSGEYLQPPGRENVRINFWKFNKNDPADDSLLEFVVNDFVFVPPAE